MEDAPGQLPEDAEETTSSRPCSPSSGASGGSSGRRGSGARRSRGTPGRPIQIRPKRSPARERSKARIPRLWRGWTVQTRPKRSPARGQIRPKRSPALRGRRGLRRPRYHDAITEKLGCRPDDPADLPGPGRGLQLRLQLRVGEAVRAEARAEAARVRRDAQPAWGRGAGGFLPGPADPGRQEWAVAPAVGLPDDAVPLASRVRGSGVGPEARDLPRPARERVSGTSAGSRGSSATTT